MRNVNHWIALCGFLGSDWSPNNQGHDNRVKRVSLDYSCRMHWCSGESKGFSSSSNLTSYSFLLLWALQLFVSFGLLNSFLPYFSLHSSPTPILHLHFSRSALTSSISSFLPGCNIVLIFIHSFRWHVQNAMNPCRSFIPWTYLKNIIPHPFDLLCSSLINPSIFPHWAFLAYFFLHWCVAGPTHDPEFSLAPLLQPAWQGRPACSYATAGVANRVIGTCMPPHHVKA